MEHETFWTLVTDLAHWEFEIFLIILFDGVVGLLIWPYIKHFIEDHRKLHKIISNKRKMKKKAKFYPVKEETLKTKTFPKVKAPTLRANKKVYLQGDVLSGYRNALKKGQLGGKGWGY